MYPFRDHSLAIAWLLHVEHQTKLQEQAYVVKLYSWWSVGDEGAIPELGVASREATLVFLCMVSRRRATKIEDRIWQ